MYNELDDLLSEQAVIDSWYDDGFLIAQDIMDEFTNDDWQQLSEEVLKKDLEWQKKIVYCLDNRLIQEELEIIGKLFLVQDNELMEMCIDTLRAFDNEIGHQFIKRHPEIIKEVKEKKNIVGSVTRTIFQSFLDKFSEC